MIAWLKGVLRDKRPPRLLLDVHGVGYELEAPMTTFYRLPPAGEGTALFVHEVLREDARALYAFSTARDRDVFRLLLRVNGVGAKLALAVLSGMDSATLAQCVTQGDTQSLSRLPGIGKKTAERLVLDLRDRLAVLPPLGTLGAGGEPPVPAPPCGCRFGGGRRVDRPRAQARGGESESTRGVHRKRRRRRDHPPCAAIDGQVRRRALRSEPDHDLREPDSISFLLIRNRALSRPIPGPGAGHWMDGLPMRSR